MTQKIQHSSTQRNPILHWLALIGWGLIALAHLILFVFDLRVDFAQMLVPCAGGLDGGCNFLAISEAEVAVLTAWGLTPRAYASAMLTISVIVLLVYWSLGGLILWRQGTSWFGLALSLALIIMPIQTYSTDTDWTLVNPNLVWLGTVVVFLGTIIMLLFLYLIPNGRFSPRWAYIPMICTILLIGGAPLEISGIITLPAQVEPLVNITTFSLVLLGGSLQIYRYLKDSNPIERQQTKWILFGILSFIVAVIIWVIIFARAVDIPDGAPRLLANVIGGFSSLFTITALPVAITIAILRYKLWDIDLIIRRTLVYAVLTGLLAFVYFGLVLLLQSTFNLVSDQQSPVVIVISTLVIAALFTPLRQWVQAFIDRRFFRRKYDAEQILAQFAQTARDETDLDRLTSELVRVVQETMQPESVSVWLKKTPK